MTCCPICGSAGDPRFETTDENQRVSADLFVYAACNCCGTIFLANPPAELKRYYEPDYYEIPSPGRLAAIAAKDRHKIDVVNRFARAKRLLEIGPAFGVFVLQARSEGYDVDALEMDERCCQSLREIEQVRVIQSDAPHQAIAALPRHDVMALWHVIEHLPDPRSTVEAAHAWLRPGGVLGLSTGDVASLTARLHGRDWSLLTPPWHQFFFSRGTMKRLLTDVGFDVIRVGGDGNVGVDADSARPRVPALAARLFASRPVSTVARKLGAGGIMFVFARKA